jgi:hypothetical protein
MRPSKLELLRQALAEIGEASAQELSAHLEQRHGVKVEARYIPFLRASLLEAEVVETVRQTARMLAEQASKEQDEDDKTSKAKTQAPPTPA